jgi:hypothetical protein
MTDIIKFLEEVDSKNVMRYLKERPETIEENFKDFPRGNAGPQSYSASYISLR